MQASGTCNREYLYEHAAYLACRWRWSAYPGFGPSERAACCASCSYKACSPKLIRSKPAGMPSVWSLSFGWPWAQFPYVNTRSNFLTSFTSCILHPRREQHPQLRQLLPHQLLQRQLEQPLSLPLPLLGQRLYHQLAVDRPHLLLLHLPSPSDQATSPPRSSQAGRARYPPRHCS